MNLQMELILNALRGLGFVRKDEFSSGHLLDQQMFSREGMNFAIFVDQEEQLIWVVNDGMILSYDGHQELEFDPCLIVELIKNYIETDLDSIVEQWMSKNLEFGDNELSLAQINGYPIVESMEETFVPCHFLEYSKGFYEMFQHLTVKRLCLLIHGNPNACDVERIWLDSNKFNIPSLWVDSFAALEVFNLPRKLSDRIRWIKSLARKMILSEDSLSDSDN